MPELPDFDWPEREDRARFMLGFSGIVGGGVLGYFAVQAIKKGDLFYVEPEPAQPESLGQGLANFVVGAIVMGLTGVSMHETIEEHGVAPLAWGAAAISGAALLGHFIGKMRKR